MEIEVRKLEFLELDFTCKIYSECFPREKNHKLWLQANFNAFPRMVYFVATFNNEIVGYSLWSIKNGFRENSIVELEQLAVLPSFSGKGIGKELLCRSYDLFKLHLLDLGFGVKAVYMTTREGNFAESLYSKVFGVERHGVIKNYGSRNEVILFKRFV